MTEEPIITVAILIGVAALTLAVRALANMRQMNNRVSLLESAENIRIALDMGQADVIRDPLWPALAAAFDRYDIGTDILVWTSIPNAAIVGWREIALRELKRRYELNAPLRAAQRSGRGIE